jgi:hypothetical protein
MALIGNRSVLLKSPGRYFGGSTVSDNRSNFGTPGSTRGRYFGGVPAINATPSGYRPPYSWILAIKNGEMSSTNAAVMSVGAAGDGAMGVPIDGTASFLIDTNTPAGQLISSAIGSASFAVAPTGNARATLSGGGSSTMTFTTNTPAMSAQGRAQASGDMAVTATLTSYAKGMMIGSTGGTSSIVNANIVSVNGYSVTGNGQPGTEWGP